MSLMDDQQQTQRLAQMAIRDRLDHFVSVAFHNQFHERLVKEPYLEPLCCSLQEAVEAAQSRLLINIPPRHLKSFSAAICAPAFVLGKDPRQKIMVVVYGADLGLEHMRQFRQIVSSRWYKATFPECVFKTLRDDAAYTDSGGSIRFVSIGGAVTGLGVTLLIVDDVIKAQDVSSSVRRETVERFVQQTCMTRFDDPRETRIIVISQRLHVHDLASRLLEQARYSHLSLPAIADRTLSLRGYGGRIYEVKAGDLISPTRFTHHELQRLREEMGEAAFLAQFLQAPVPGDGPIVDMARLSYIEKCPEPGSSDYTVMSIDPAVRTGETNDFTAITVFGYSAGRWRLQDMLERRLDYVDLKDAAHSMALKWKPNLTLIEECHTGAALWREFPRSMYPAVCWTPKGSKAERLAVACGHFYSRRIEFPKGAPWSERVFAQLRAFPDGHDDIVDSISQFAAWMHGRDIQAIIQQRQRSRQNDGAFRSNHRGR